MRLSKSSFAALAIAIIAILIIPCFAFAVTQARELENGNKLAVEAQNSKSRIEQGQKFDKALQAYAKVVSEDPKGSPSPAAAEALLATAKIRAGLPIEATPDQPLKKVYNSKVVQPSWFGLSSREVSIQNDDSARATFKQIIQKFGEKSKTELLEDYGPDDAPKIANAVDQAKAYEGKIEDQILEKNKHKTLYKIIDFLVTITGSRPGFSYWFAIILIAVIVKILISPLTKAQFKSMKEMQKVSPLIKEIQEKYKGDPAEINKRTMSLYSEHGINPLMGCLPLLAQMPVLYLVYAMIRSYEIHFADGTFLWIGWKPLDHLWGWTLPIGGGGPVWVTAANLAQPDLLLLLLYTASMIISQRISIVDPTQAEQQKMMSIMMPIMFFFLFGSFPSAFVLYWFVFNVLSTWQQYHIIHGGAQAEEAAQPSAPSSTPSQRTVRRRRRRR